MGRQAISVNFVYKGKPLRRSGFSMHIFSFPCLAGFRVQGAGFRVQGSRCRVQGAGCRVQGSGCRVQGSGCRVQGSGFRVEQFVCGERARRGGCAMCIFSFPCLQTEKTHVYNCFIGSINTIHLRCRAVFERVFYVHMCFLPCLVCVLGSTRKQRHAPFRVQG